MGSRNIINEKRPWGEFYLLADNEACTVKIIKIKGRLSLQSHKLRDEFWYVVSGRVEVQTGQIKEGELDIKNNLELRMLDEGSFIDIPRNTLHRIASLNGDARVLEISRGYFDENDETRYEDDYRRV